MRNTQKPIEALFFAYHGLIGVLLGVIAILIAHGFFAESPILKEISVAIGSTFIVGSLFGLLYTNIQRRFYYDELRYLVEREQTGFRGMFASTVVPELTTELTDKLTTAKEIKMYGIALNILWNPDLVNHLKQAAADRHCRVVILLADVDSPYIQERLHEEEGFPFPHTQGREVITNLYDRLKEIETQIGDKNYFCVRRFTHYPAFALIIADEDVFCYPYGYKTVGTVSPVVHLEGYRSPQVRYYRAQFDALLADYPE